MFAINVQKLKKMAPDLSSRRKNRELSKNRQLLLQLLKHLLCQIPRRRKRRKSSCWFKRWTVKEATSAPSLMSKMRFVVEDWQSLQRKMKNQKRRLRSYKSSLPRRRWDFFSQKLFQNIHFILIWFKLFCYIFRINNFFNFYNKLMCLEFLCKIIYRFC